MFSDKQPIIVSNQ